MLRMIQSTNAARARSYYSSADYYSEGQELAGVWRGKGAGRLGLEGDVRPDDWDALCDHRNPATGLPLTQRRKTDRSVGYDFNFHAPKSVSLLYSLSEDPRILDAFKDAVDRTMQDMEAEMQTRVRSKGQNEDRTTGNMLWGEFVHLTARPVGGVPDPHLHAHCFVFNATWDSQEDRWKAGQFRGLKRDAPYFEAVFHSRLSGNLAELGMPIERTRKGWEIGGLAEPMLRKFSRRTAQIEKVAREKGITDDAVKDELGATTRERKQKHLTMDQLREEWRGRLTPDEESALARTMQQSRNEDRGTDRGSRQEREQVATDAVRSAADHCFERSSVMPERRVLAEALKRSIGTPHQASVAEVTRAFERHGFITAEREGRRMVTTREVLGEERRMLEFAREGRGTCAPLMSSDPNHRFTREWLNDGQRRAVLHVLGSRDRVTIVRGAAGVGKTSMMLETVEAIESGGRRVLTFAPSADASRGVLRNEGFAEADTVARLLQDQRLQQQARGQVVWIDEAGLLGTRTMRDVFDLAERLDARVVLSGDVRQHGSVERGAALRLLEDEGGLRPAEIKEIQRQKGTYKQAVKALSEERTAEGFKALDAMGWVKEVPEEERDRTLAGEYVRSIKEGKTALVVSPTHREGDRITGTIRAELKAAGKVGKADREVSTLIDTKLTESERRDPTSYSREDVLVFHQNAAGGFQRGQRVAVSELSELPLDQAARFSVFRPGSIGVAPGDTLRVTKNGTTADGAHRLNNGALYKVRRFTPKGDLVLANGWTVAKDYGHLAHGYVVTSHASQGKTVDRVFIGQSSQSFAASSREQFYVSVSRGREKAVVYTDDRHALMEAVGRTDERLSATELVTSKARKARVRTVLRQYEAARRPADRPRTIERERELA